MAEARRAFLSTSDRRTRIPVGTTLDLLILRIIAREPMHGWGIMLRLRQLQVLKEN